MKKKREINCPEYKQCLEEAANLNLPNLNCIKCKKNIKPEQKVKINSRTLKEGELPDLITIFTRAEIPIREVIEKLSPGQQKFISFMRLSRFERAHFIQEIHERLQLVYGDTKYAESIHGGQRVKGGWSMDHTRLLMNLSHGGMSQLIQLSKKGEADAEDKD